MAELTIPAEQRRVLKKMGTISDDAVRALATTLERSPAEIPSISGLSSEDAEQIKNAAMDLYKVRAYFDMEMSEFVEAVAQKMQETESMPADQIANFKKRLTKLLTISPAATGNRTNIWAAHTHFDNSLAQHLALAQPVQDHFLELAKRWRTEIKTVSSTTDMVLNSAYQDIIGMGKLVLPLIFRELHRNGGHWFWALRHITQENPASPQDAGNIEKITEAWLRWGREHHYL
ncbi:MAG TPA: hypothetical protein VG759_01065 [Candidatus Angelobacter sp.]|nr:hypothetical protein [Candidatus Angelobacter sp.]